MTVDITTNFGYGDLSAVNAANDEEEPMSGDTLAVSRTAPWIGGGNPIETDESLSVEEALRVTGLDWEVEKRPLMYRTEDGRTVKIEDKYAVVQKDNDDFKGVVAAGYKLYQNAEAFRVIDFMRDEGGVKLRAGGTRRNGKVAWLVVQMPEGFKVGNEDEHELYCMFETSHDGTMSVKYTFSPIRLDCLNMVPIFRKSAVGAASFWHTGDLDAKVEDARRVLSQAPAYVENFKEGMEQLLEIPLADDKAVDAVLNRVLPERPKTPEVVAQIRGVLHGSPHISDDYRQTGYGLFQAVSEYYDHVKPYRTPQSRLNSHLVGDAARYRRRTFDTLTSLA